MGFGPATMALICSSTKVKTDFNNFVHKIIKTYTIGISAGGADAKAGAGVKVADGAGDGLDVKMAASADSAGDDTVEGETAEVVQLRTCSLIL